MPLLPERDRYQAVRCPHCTSKLEGFPRSKAVIFPVFSPGAVRSLDAAGAFLCSFFGVQEIKSEFFRKKYCFFGRVMVLYQSRHDATEYGRLAQLVEHLLDVQEVTGSSPVPSTTKIPSQMTRDFLRGRDRTRTARPRRRRGKQQPSGLLFSARFPTARNVYQESTACRSTICTASVGRDRTGTM